MIDIDIVVIWTCAQTWDGRQISSENDNETSSFRDPQIPDRNLESRRNALGIGI